MGEKWGKGNPGGLALEEIKVEGLKQEEQASERPIQPKVLPQAGEADLSDEEGDEKKRVGRGLSQLKNEDSFVELTHLSDEG